MTTATVPTWQEVFGLESVTVSQEALDRFKECGVVPVLQTLQRLGFNRLFMYDVLPRTERETFVGTAFTLHTVPIREDVAKASKISLHRQSFNTINPGQVLVIDARGDTSAGVLGDNLATGMAARGAAALVTDGSILDLAGMREVKMPLFSRGLQGRTFGNTHFAAAINVPIQCAGVLVMPGDVIVGDATGVAVVPQAVAEQVSKEAWERELQDGWTRKMIEDGAPLNETFPPNAHYKALFEAWRKEQGK